MLESSVPYLARIQGSLLGQDPGSLLGQDPGVLEDLLGAVPLEGVHHEAPGDELLGGVGDVVPVGAVELEEPGQDLVEELLLVVGAAGEGRVAAEQDVHDHTDRPHVHLNRAEVISIVIAIAFIS